MKGINTPQNKILDALFSLYMATAEQLTRLLFSENSQAYIRRNIKPLIDSNYVTVLNEYTRTVNDPKVFGVGAKGWKYLKQQGYPIKKRHRDIKGKLPLGYPLRHTLAVNDVLISAKLIIYEEPSLQLKHICHEIEFKREPIVVTLPSGKLYNLRPDLLLVFDDHFERLIYMCEINLTVMNQIKYRTKVQAYNACHPIIDQRFHPPKHFHSNIIDVLFFIQTPEHFPKQTAGNPDLVFELEAARDREKRKHDLIEWAAEETARLPYRKKFGFMFSDIPINSMSPIDLFYTQYWNYPSGEGLSSLLV